VALEPNRVDARYVYALLLMAVDRLSEAVAQIDYAARLDPLSAQVNSTYGRVLYRARRFEEARIRLERALELEPRNVRAYGRLAEVHEQLGAAQGEREKRSWALACRPACTGGGSE
jgi:Flp pilus assembly protein TadD